MVFKYNEFEEIPLYKWYYNSLLSLLRIYKVSPLALGIKEDNPLLSNIDVAKYVIDKRIVMADKSWQKDILKRLNKDISDLERTVINDSNYNEIPPQPKIKEKPEVDSHYMKRMNLISAVSKNLNGVSEAIKYVYTGKNSEVMDRILRKKGITYSSKDRRVKYPTLLNLLNQRMQQVEKGKLLSANESKLFKYIGVDMTKYSEENIPETIKKTVFNLVNRNQEIKKNKLERIVEQENKPFMDQNLRSHSPYNNGIVNQAAYQSAEMIGVCLSKAFSYTKNFLRKIFEKKRVEYA